MGWALKAAYLALRSERELFGKGLKVELGGKEEAVEERSETSSFPQQKALHSDLVYCVTSFKET